MQQSSCPVFRPYMLQPMEQVDSTRVVEDRLCFNGNSSTKTAKTCGVCGDRAKSYHFGGISCDSCKAFFRRSVQNEAHKNFHCPYDGRCHISMSSRKCCQFCRFKKCLAIGMEQSWVMSEEERLRLQVLRLQKRMTQEQKHKWSSSESEDQSGPPVATFLHDHLSPEEVVALNSLTSVYQSLISSNEETFANKPTDSLPLTQFIVWVQNLIQFCNCVPEFNERKTFDKMALLRNGVYEMYLTANFHIAEQNLHRLSGSNSWTSSSLSSSLSSSASSSSCCSFSESEDESWRCQLDMSSPMPDVKNFPLASKCLRQFKDDLRPLVLLLLVILFNPDTPGLMDKLSVSANQERCCNLLRRYLDWKVGTGKSGILFANMLSLLPELRELNERFGCKFVQFQGCDVESAMHWMENNTFSSSKFNVKCDANNNLCDWA